MSEFITITKAAAAKITDLMLEEEKKLAEVGLRVYVQGGGCSGFQYGLAIEEGTRDSEADQVFESNGVRLYVDPISVRYLSGAQVDYDDKLNGGGFNGMTGVNQKILELGDIIEITVQRVLRGIFLNEQVFFELLYGLVHLITLYKSIVLKYLTVRGKSSCAKPCLRCKLIKPMLFFA